MRTRFPGQTLQHVRWTSTISTQISAADAMGEACETSLSRLAGDPPDAAFVFLSGYSPSQVEAAAEEIVRRTGARNLLGCTAGGVVGGGREVEHRPAISLTLASLPDVDIQPFYINSQEYPDGDAPPSEWHQRLGVRPGPNLSFVVVPEPFSADPQRLIDGLDYAYPGAAKIGGLASGGSAEGINRLLLNGKFYRNGTVGFALSGAIEVGTAVAQGCKPVGASGKVTKARGPFLIEIDNRPALEFVREQVEALSEEDRELARVSLFFGIAMDPFHDGPPAAGDFLIRNIMGVDAQRGYVAIGAELTLGRVLQLHVRDRRTSEDDLVAVLRRVVEPAGGTGWKEPGASPAGALMFSCLGRGRHLYGEADKDTRLFQGVVGEVPLGGFFCNGEIGPVSGDTHLHGFTSSFGLFRPSSVHRGTGHAR
jgi:small ligand-binding sensory domain FIST